MASAREQAAARHELAPSGELIVGLVQAPTAGLFFVRHDAGDAAPVGVAATLGEAMAHALGCEFAFRVFHNSGECTAAVAAGDVGAAFMPVDEERRRRVTFGPAYYVLESTYLVAGQPGLKTLADVDAPEVRVLGIAGTTTIRASARSLSRTAPIPVRSVAQAVSLLARGDADALALSRDSLTPLLRALPGSHIVEGGFQRTGVAVAVKQGRMQGLTFVTAFIGGAKRSGFVRRTFDRMGFASEAVAPVEE